MPKLHSKKEVLQHWLTHLNPTYDKDAW